MRYLIGGKDKINIAVLLGEDKFYIFNGDWSGYKQDDGSWHCFPPYTGKSVDVTDLANSLMEVDEEEFLRYADETGTREYYDRRMGTTKEEKKVAIHPDWDIEIFDEMFNSDVPF